MVGGLTLLEFIEARLSATEAATLRYRDGHEGPCINYDGQDPDAYDEFDSCARHLAAAGETPYRDAEFGLRDVAAKRRLLAYLANLEALALADNLWNVDTYSPYELLALPYAEHPDYDPSWSPS